MLGDELHLCSTSRRLLLLMPVINSVISGRMKRCQFLAPGALGSARTSRQLPSRPPTRPPALSPQIITGADGGPRDTGVPALWRPISLSVSPALDSSTPRVFLIIFVFGFEAFYNIVRGKNRLKLRTEKPHHNCNMELLTSDLFSFTLLR